MDLKFSFLLKSKGLEVLMSPILFVLNYSWTLLHLRKLQFWKFLKVVFCSNKQLIHTSFFFIKSFIVASDNYLYPSLLTGKKVYITQQSSFLYLFLNLGCGSLFFYQNWQGNRWGRKGLSKRKSKESVSDVCYLLLSTDFLASDSLLSCISLLCCPTLTRAYMYRTKVFCKI